MGYQPYKYQQTGINFLIDKSRAILGDDVGLGKTSQALFAAEDCCPILIIAPGNATGVWEEQIRQYRPELEIPLVYRGTPKERDWLAETILKERPKVVIATYQMMSELQRISRWWDTIIFDESHTLKNPKAKTLYNVAKLFSSEKLYFLTATPVVNGAADLWTSMNMINHVRFPSYWKWVNRYSIVYDNPYAAAKVVEGTNPKTAPELQELMSDYMIRRTAEQVGLELPEKTRQVVPIDLHPKQRKAYYDLVKDMMTETSDGGLLLTPNPLSKMTRLRQLLVCPRLLDIDAPSPAIDTIVGDLDNMSEPVVIFTPFAKAIDHIGEALASTHYRAREISGRMTPQEISENVQWFKRGDARVLISTIQMGTAWSATAARIAYFIGYTFSLKDHVQAEGRLRRHGQHHPTLMKYLTHNNTIDEHIMDVLSQKTTWQRLATDPTKLLKGH